MLNGKEIEQALKQALPKVDQESIQRAVKAVIEASGKWKEVDLKETFGANYSIQCKDICCLGEAHGKGLKIRAFIEES